MSPAWALEAQHVLQASPDYGYAEALQDFRCKHAFDSDTQGVSARTSSVIRCLAQVYYGAVFIMAPRRLRLRKIRSSTRDEKRARN